MATHTTSSKFSIPPEDVPTYLSAQKYKINNHPLIKVQTPSNPKGKNSLHQHPIHGSSHQTGIINKQQAITKNNPTNVKKINEVHFQGKQ